MIALGNLMIATAGVLHSVIFVFYILLLAHVVLSWVSPDPRNPIVSFIYQSTEPILSKIRNKVPPLGIIDVSPILVFLLKSISMKAKKMAQSPQYIHCCEAV